MDLPVIPLAPGELLFVHDSPSDQIVANDSWQPPHVSLKVDGGIDIRCWRGKSLLVGLANVVGVNWIMTSDK